MIRNLSISITVPDEKIAQILTIALLPETLSSITSRSRVKIKNINKLMTIDIEAKDLVSLRATFNSYLRWISLILDLHQVLEGLPPNL
jgi:KEOPS complex subunit Pcc1